MPDTRAESRAVEAPASAGVPPFVAAAPDVPAAPAAPAAPVAADDFERWKRAVDRVKERKLLLGTCLEEGAFLGLSGTAVRVALTPEHSFHRAMLEMKENREILNQEFESQFGRGATLACVIGDPFGATAAAARVREDLLSDADAAAAAPQAPSDAPPAAPSIVQRIVEIFDGEILDLGGEAGASGRGIA
jgi:hypothetical protein